MIETDNIEGIFKEVQKNIHRNKIRVISIDGDTGAGKSTLAQSISNKMEIEHLKLDKERYFHQNQGGCLKYIKYEILLSDINEIDNSGNIAIVDSVCVLKILDNIEVKSDLKLYVKRLSSYGHWYDGSKFDYTRSAAEIIQEEINGAMMVNQVVNLPANTYDADSVRRNTLQDEIIEYHFEYRPDDGADIVYNRFMNSA